MKDSWLMLEETNREVLAYRKKSVSLKRKYKESLENCLDEITTGDSPLEGCWIKTNKHTSPCGVIYLQKWLIFSLRVVPGENLGWTCKLNSNQFVSSRCGEIAEANSQLKFALEIKT